MASTSPLVERGSVHLYRLVDLADRIDVDTVEAALSAQGVPSTASGPGGHRDPAPAGVSRLGFGRGGGALSLATAPLVVAFGSVPVTLAGSPAEAEVRVTLFDFGVLSTRWTLPLPAADLGAAAHLVATLGAAETVASLADAQQRHLDRLRSVLADDLPPRTALLPAETFTVVSVGRFAGPVEAAELAADPRVAACVIGERAEFSPRLLAELDRSSFSYSTTDLTVVGYDGAFVWDPEADDIASVLEFALAQVLELDALDALLDERLGRLNAAVGPAARRGPRLSGLGRSPFESARSDLLRQQIELTQIAERVVTAVNVTDDLYYAAIYRAAGRAFHADELMRATSRKLELMFRTYTMLADQVDTQIAHRLEWIIIILIAVEIVMGLAAWAV